MGTCAESCSRREPTSIFAIPIAPRPRTWHDPAVLTASRKSCSNPRMSLGSERMWYQYEIGTGTSSVNVHGDDVHDAGNEQHEKQRQMQHVPQREQPLIRLERADAPRGIQAAIDVLARHGIQAIPMLGERRRRSRRSQ